MNMPMNNKIRATRATGYPNGSSAQTDLSARQGEYIQKRGDDTLQDMILRACQKFPNDVVDIEYDGKHQGRYMLKTNGSVYYVEVPSNPEPQMSTIVVVKSSVVDEIIRVPTVDAELRFLDTLAANITNWEDYDAEDREAVLDNGYEKFGNGNSVCLTTE